MIARTIRQYIYEETQLSCFFDLHDIPHGQPVKRSIEDAIRESVVVAIWTDRFLDSPWCQFEVIEARRQQRPMLVLDALVAQTPRLFPFLGNMPVVRWTDNCPTVVTAILLELLRSYHLWAVFDKLSLNEQHPPVFGLHPPDLLDSSLKESIPSSSSIFVYPDPPIKPSELELLQGILPKKRFLSLIEWRALRAANAVQTVWDLSTEPRPNPFRGKQIGISVSISDTWAELGLISNHQDDLTADIALE